MAQNSAVLVARIFENSSVSIDSLRDFRNPNYLIAPQHLSQIGLVLEKHYNQGGVR